MNDLEFIKYLKELNINITSEQLKDLYKFYKHLLDYNSKTNLTSITKKEEVYLKHFYDSLTLVKSINLDNALSLCDVGTGAGFPGLILKIIFPNIKLTLIESIGKKTTFLKEIVNLLNLKDVEIINDRVENFARNSVNRYDVVTCRAVSSLNIISELCIPITKVNGYFIPMKGEIIEDTSFLSKLNSKVEKIYKFNLPIENSKRTLIKIKKLQETNELYPRNYKTMKEKPLK